MPRSHESPISRMLQFFKVSHIDVAQIGLDLARDIVKERRARAGQTEKDRLFAATVPARLQAAAENIAQQRKQTPAATPKAAAKAAKPKASGATLSRAAILERARAAKAAKAKTAAKVKPGPALAAGKPATAAKPKTKRSKARRQHSSASSATAAADEATLQALPPQRSPIEGDLDFVEEHYNEVLDPVDDPAVQELIGQD